MRRMDGRGTCCHVLGASDFCVFVNAMFYETTT
jgi:hypothetical protein